VHLEASRAQVAVAARRLVTDRLVIGTSGNVSARDSETGHVAITPSGVSYADLSADDIVLVDPSGMVVDGNWMPSSELPMHLAVYRLRPDVMAIVHTHSPHATAFAACGRAIPAIHYDIAAIGNPIRVAPYATYGTDALADNAVRTLGTDQAVLLENHGVLAVGTTVEHAYAIAQKVEYLAELYVLALQLGEPNLLADAEIEKVKTKLKSYGQKTS
jgi:L-fuculose-phosphate aldolase